MQKKIIALAIAAAFSAPAFAETSIYGVLDAGYGDTNKTLAYTTAYGTQPGGTAAQVALAGKSVKSGQAALEFSAFTSSRLGFLTTEELSDGNKAALKIETALGSNPMAGVAQTGTSAVAYNGTTIDATSLGSRELNVSLAFAQGTTIKAGYGSTPVRDFTLAYDASFGGNLIGNALLNDATLSSNRATTVDVSQQFGPVKGTVSISHNTDYTDNKTDTQKNNGYLLAAQYVDGPLSAGFAYQDLKNATPAVAAVTATGIYAGAAPISGTNPGTPGAAAVLATETTQKTMLLAGSYDLTVAKLFAQYANIKNDDSMNLNAAGEGKRTYESVGAQAPFGPVLGFVQFSHGSVDQVTYGITATTAGIASNSRTISGYSLGGKYILSKLTYAYASLGETKLDSAASAMDTGIKVNQYTLGLVHTF